MAKVVKTFRAEVRSVDSENFKASVVISTGNVDRYKERVLPSAFKETIATFMEHPVLLSSHAYRGLLNQIGEFEQIKIVGNEVHAVPKYYVGEGNPEADWAWKLVEKKIAAFSIGFLPVNYKDYNDEEAKENEGSRRDYTKIELLEASQVLVPANRESLQKGFEEETDPMAKDYYEMILDLAKELDVEEKGVIPYKKESLAPKDSPWNAGPEMKGATPEQLKRMCTWYAGDGEMRGDYKLPHHKQSGYSTVWRGVANAAARLAGTQLPAADRSGVKAHLAGHYRDFDETPPWSGKKELWDEYEKACEERMAIPEEWLKELFPDVEFPLEDDSFEDIEIVVEGWEETENEIRHRLKDPGQFDKFRYFALKKDKPRVNGIYGHYKTKDEWALQALRFPKADGWTMAEAKKWVSAHPDLKKDFLWHMDVIESNNLDDLLSLDENALPQAEQVVNVIDLFRGMQEEIRAMAEALKTLADAVISDKVEKIEEKTTELVEEIGEDKMDEIRSILLGKGKTEGEALDEIKKMQSDFLSSFDKVFLAQSK